jgi:hypothetical protein
LPAVTGLKPNCFVVRLITKSASGSPLIISKQCGRLPILGVCSKRLRRERSMNSRRASNRTDFILYPLKACIVYRLIHLLQDLLTFRYGTPAPSSEKPRTLKAKVVVREERLCGLARGCSLGKSSGNLKTEIRSLRHPATKNRRDALDRISER